MSMAHSSSCERIYAFLLWQMESLQACVLFLLASPFAATLYKSLATSWQVGTLILNVPLRVYGYK